MVRVVILIALGLGLAAGACTERRGHACGPVGKKKNVKVTLVVILASYTSTKTDKGLERIAKKLRKCCPKLKGFRMASMTGRSLPVNKKTTFQLVEKQLVKIVIKHGADKRNRVSLTVSPPKTATITYRTKCGKFLPIVTPYHTKKGQRLILAVCVEPCNGK